MSDSGSILGANATINARDWGAKFRSKKECYSFLCVPVGAYLPPLNTITSYHIRDLISGDKKVMELKLDYDYIIGKVLHLSMFLCDWSNFDSLTSQINKALKKRNKVIEPFSYLGVTDDAKLSHLAAEIYMKDKLTDKSKTKVLPNKYNHKKPRIGYLHSKC